METEQLGNILIGAHTCHCHMFSKVVMVLVVTDTKKSITSTILNFDKEMNLPSSKSLTSP